MTPDADQEAKKDMKPDADQEARKDTTPDTMPRTMFESTPSIQEARNAMFPVEGLYKRDLIIEFTTNFMFPFTLLFGLYVMFGTAGTGGGFEGGTVLAAAFILYITVFGHVKGREKCPESTNAFFKSFGLFLYNAAGWTVILFSLAAAQWLNMPGFWPVANYVGVAGARSWTVGYMVSVGIGLTVMAAFMSQYFDLGWKEEEEMEAWKEEKEMEGDER